MRDGMQLFLCAVILFGAYCAALGVIAGRIQTGSYTNRDGQKVYTTDVIVDEQEFADSKGGQNGGRQQQETPSDIGDGFMNIPDGVEDEGLPFN